MHLQISLIIRYFFGTIVGLSLGLIFVFTHKIAWTRVALLCLLWTATYYIFRILYYFIIAGILATFLTLIILGKLEPRKPSTQYKIEEK